MELCGYIFDMDGVLIDNSAYYGAAWERFLKSHPEAALPDYPAVATFGRRNADLLPLVWGRTLSPEELQKLGEEIENYYREMYWPRMTPVPGLLRFVDELRGRTDRIALATSAPAENVDFTLAKLGLKDCFKVVLSEEDVRRGKPDPQIYTDAIARLGCPPSDSVVFEDALAGVEAALGAGAHCVALSTTYPRDQLLAYGAELVISDFTDPALFAFLSSQSPRKMRVHGHDVC